MDFLRATRVLSALSVAIGALAIVTPATVADLFGFDIQQASGLGFGEIGAVYGGNFIGLGLVGLYATREQVDEGPMLTAAIGVVWLCIAAGRMLVMATRPQVAWTWFGLLSFVVEAGVGAVFLLGARSGSRLS
jgi:hypothetical protein